MMSVRMEEKPGSETVSSSKLLTVGLEFKGAKRNFVNDNVDPTKKFQNFTFEANQEGREEPFGDIGFLNEIWVFVTTVTQ